MRSLLAVTVVCIVAGCASDEAARRVQIVGARPASCPVVDARLRGEGENATAALRDLRRRAAHERATHVVVTDGPRSAGPLQVVDAIGYACPAP